MCGIVGYVGKTRKTSFLIDALSKLEYRGYDSAGFATLKNNKINVQKQEGNIEKIRCKISKTDVFETGIAHTRWATHGKPNEINAHPHLSSKGSWVVVHNGIIENYNELKIKYNLSTQSETDTAVVSEMLEKMNAKNINDFIDVFGEFKGSYAIAAMFEGDENKIFLAKNKSPLYIAENESCGFMVASDPICFVGFSKNYYSLNDNEFAVVDKKQVTFFDSQKIMQKKSKNQMDDIFENADKGNYSHFMLKEIMEEKRAILRLVEDCESREIFRVFDDWFLTKFNEVKFIGCGTAYHASLMGAKYMQKILDKKASAEMASEFIYSEPNFVSHKTLYIFVSQSGETADTLRALEIVKQQNATAICMTNVLYSSLAKKSDYVLPISAGVEVAVASTKAYVNMLVLMFLFCKYFESRKDFLNAISEIKMLAENILNFDKNQIKKIAEKIKNENQAIFIGKDLDYITALEASLKLKEVSYINANAYPAGELKHGFLALVEKDTPVFVFANQESIMTKTLNSMHEAESRGANSIVFSHKDKNLAENKIKISSKNELISQIEAISSMQYLAYMVSILKNINPDQPRNLAKSVTVE